MNVTAVEFDPRPTPTPTQATAGLPQAGAGHAAQPDLPARTPALIPGSAWPSGYSDSVAPVQSPHPAPPGAPPMQQATEQHATLTATQHTPAMYFTPGTLPGAQGHAGAPPGMYFPCLGTPPPPSETRNFTSRNKNIREVAGLARAGLQRAIRIALEPQHSPNSSPSQLIQAARGGGGDGRRRR